MKSCDLCKKREAKEIVFVDDKDRGLCSYCYDKVMNGDYEPWEDDEDD